MTEGAKRRGKAEGSGAKRAALYVRVSTEEQAEKGYSIPDQLRELGDHAAREGYRIVEEVVDDGYTGSEPHRPGLARVMELARVGAVDLVLAKKRDRFFRSRFYRLLWDRDLHDLGVRLLSLNDTGNRFGDAMQDEFAEWEREEITRRTTDGRLSKAREGRVVTPGRPRYGFQTRASGDGWEVDEEKMEVVRRIFRMVGAEGASLRSVKNTFEREGIPTPRGARFWDRSFFTSCIKDDVYRPHTAEEVRALVSAKVGSGLEAGSCYGISWHNTRGLKVGKVPDRSSETGFRKTYEWYEKPEEEHIPVPVPDSGIPRALVDAARAAIEQNRAPSRAGRRFWELSGGVALCAECGRRMLTRHKPKWKNGKRYEYDYYHCSGHHSDGREACANSRNAAAGKLEAHVWERVRGFLAQPERLEVGLNRLVEEEREGLLADPRQEVERLEKKVAAADRKRARFQLMAAEDEPLISFEELRKRLAEQEAVKRAARERITALSERSKRVERLERDRDAMLEHYKAVVPPRLGRLSPEQRRRIHAVLGTEALVGGDGAVEVRLNRVRIAVDSKDGDTADPQSDNTEGSSTYALTAAL